MVFPKQVLEMLVKDIFSFGDMKYRVDIINRTAVDLTDGNALRSEQITSEILPFTVYSTIGYAFYWQFLASKLWIGLLGMACALVVHLFLIQKGGQKQFGVLSGSSYQRAQLECALSAYR